MASKVTTVEFRLLQYIISHVTGDRVSVGVLHWDGAALRVAHSMDHLGVCEPAQRDVVKATVAAVMRRARRTAQKVGKSAELDMGLAALFPVREGLGGALYWTPVTRSKTADPERHFEELARTIRGPERHHAKRRVTERALFESIVRAAEPLRAAQPERVKLEHEVRNQQSYRSPLSWKNGKWHHVLPFSFDGADIEDIERLAQRIVGLAELALPKKDVPVVLAVYPEDAKLARKARAEANIACRALADRDCAVIPAIREDKAVSLKRLVSRVKRDVEQS